MGFAAGEDVDPERTCMPSGQGVGGIDEILPAGEIVRRVVAEAERTIGRLSGIVEAAPTEAAR
jgi:enoyl-[acyl-carrier protein] reductase II